MLDMPGLQRAGGRCSFIWGGQEKALREQTLRRWRSAFQTEGPTRAKAHWNMDSLPGGGEERGGSVKEMRCAGTARHLLQGSPTAPRGAPGPTRKCTARPKLAPFSSCCLRQQRHLLAACHRLWPDLGGLGHPLVAISRSQLTMKPLGPFLPLMFALEPSGERRLFNDQRQAM